MTEKQRLQLRLLFKNEFLFARDMFFGPINVFKLLIMSSFERAHEEAKKSSGWTFDG